MATPFEAFLLNQFIVVQLILAQGSRAGTKASIQDGFYMIGRHAECQIRPKSRSVSRRHCLVHRRGTDVRVLDLGSSSGTTVNDLSLKPLEWQFVADGDEIRCGKVAFTVSIPAESSIPENQTELPSDGTASVVQGEAWQDFDIASFLGNQDDADREKRYDEIRKRASEADEAEAHGFDDDRETGVDERDNDEASLATANIRPAKTRPPKKGRFKKLPSRAGNLTPTFAGREDQLKLIGAVLVAFAVIGFFVYQFVQFQSGPAVRVIKEMD